MSSSRRLHSFEFDPAWLERFIELPFHLHARDPFWVPPFRASQRRELSQANPYFAHGKCRHFVCTEGRDAIARATAFIDDKLCGDAGAPIGMVGLFESIEDESAAHRVIAAALDWLRSQRATVAWGPMSFSIWHHYRFRTVGHHEEPFLGEPYNPAYYPGLFESAGFRLMREWTTTSMDEDGMRAMAEARIPEHERVVEEGIRFRKLDPGSDEDFRRLYDQIVTAFEMLPGWTELGFDEFSFLFERYRTLYDRHLVQFALDRDGNDIGLAVMHPDLSPAFRPMKGRSGPVEKLRFLWGRRRVDRAVWPYLAIRAGYRRTGVGSAFVRILPQEALHRGYRRMVAALSPIDNPSRRFSEALGPQRRYALYSIEL